MSVEHRRQLLAFFIVALAAVLMIGNGLGNQVLRDAVNGGSTRQAAISSGVSLVPGPARIELGGSARGTTAVESGSAAAASGSRTDRPGRSRAASPVRTAPGRSDRHPTARGVGQKPSDRGSKRTGKEFSRSARTSTAGRVTDDGERVHGKKAQPRKSNARKSDDRRSEYRSGKSRRSVG
jgi:hypothetical protein